MVLGQRWPLSCRLSVVKAGRLVQPFHSSSKETNTPKVSYGNPEMTFLHHTHSPVRLTLTLTPVCALGLLISEMTSRVAGLG